MYFINNIRSKNETYEQIIIPVKNNSISELSQVYVDNIPYRIAGTRGCVFNNKIHLLGSNIANMAHYTWDNENMYTQLLPLPFKFGVGSVVVYNNEIHIMGGQYEPTSHYKWDGETWINCGVLPYSLIFSGACVYNDEIHILGGRGSGSNHYAYNGFEWRSVGELPSRIQNIEYMMNLFVIDNAIYTGAQNLYKYENGVWININCYIGNDPIFLMNNKLYVISGNNLYSIGNDDVIYTFKESFSNSVFISCEYNNENHIFTYYKSTDHTKLIFERVESICINKKNNNKIYSNKEYTIENGYYVFKNENDLKILVFDENETVLKYTNIQIVFNSETNKYELYGYFPTTLKNTTVPITQDGWQTLELDEPKLFI